VARFTAISQIPQTDVPPWQYIILSSLKENVELLTGTRGEVDGSSRAVTKGGIAVTGAPTQTMQQVTAQGAGFSVGSGAVPTLSDYALLVGNVQSLANDVASLRATLNALITQLRG
jgi:hypothetical protein